MRNTSSTKTVSVRQIILGSMNDQGATPGTGSMVLCRFSAATPTGGTAIVPIKRYSLQVVTGGWASGITDARFLDTGLTVAGVTFETAFAAIRPGAIAPAHLILDATDYKRKWPGLELAPGEGLCIRTAIAAQVAGNNLWGFVNWSERL